MTRKLPTGETIRIMPDGVLQRPDLAAKAAQVVNLWNDFERTLQFFYAYLMGRDQPRLRGYQPPIHPVALQVFDTLEAFRPKKQLFEALLKWRLGSHPDLLAEYNGTLSGSINVAARARHKVAHTLWGICDRFPDALVAAPVFGPALVWRKSDFDEELKKILKVKSAMGKFEAKVRKRLG